MKILTVVGARPQFIKAAVVSRLLRRQAREVLVHTGQHYDYNMSEIFFEELNIPKPDYNLGISGGSHGAMTGRMLMALEEVLQKEMPDKLLVYGDTNSTLAAALAAVKLHIPVCHVEAGIRSWDLTMPEEINRMVTDSLADYMFTTSEVANRNLVRQGAILNDGMSAAKPLNDANDVIALPEDKYAHDRVPQRVWHVGNVMIDTLLANKARFRKPKVWDELGLKEKEFVVMTMHRPANVDEETHLRAMMEQIIDNVHGLPVIFPIHPRTAKLFYGLWGNESELAKRFSNLHIVEPMGYLEFNYLVERAKVVVTDSGGITEETTVMGVPCITLRDNTERPETCTVGTNELIGTNPKAIKPALDKLFAGEWKKGAIPELWDGKTAERIIKILSEL